MPTRETVKRVVLLQRDGVNRIIGTFDPTIHTAREHVQFGIARGGVVEQTHARLLKIAPRYIIYQEDVFPGNVLTKPAQ